MHAVILLARNSFRGRRVALVALSVLVAVGLGTGLVALIAAQRTDDAYPDYLRDADVADVVVNPSLRTDRIAEIIRTDPAVLSATSDLLMTATMDDGAPRTAAQVTDTPAQIKASPDGRYTRQDRPVVHEGRMIGHGAEAFLNVETAEHLDVEVGDEVPLAFWDVGRADAGIVPSDTVVEALGKTTVRVVGIGRFADEILTDELYPRLKVLVTPEVVQPYTCLSKHPDDPSATIEDLLDQLLPVGCSVTYEYFSLRVAGGASGVAALIDRLTSRFDEANAQLPRALQEQDVGFYLIPAVTDDERDRVERSLDPSVTALRLFGLAAVAATLFVAVLSVVRLARRTQPDARVWWAVGATRWQRTAAIALPPAVFLVAGLAVGMLLGWLFSWIGPVASAEEVVPDPGLTMPWRAGLSVAGVALLVFAAGTVGAGLLATRADRPTAPARPSQLARTAGRAGSVPLAMGLRAAARGGGAIALLAAAVGAVVAVLGSAVFSSNLSGLVDHPDRYGWPYDVAAITGGGYGDADADAVAASLDGRPEVERWGIAALGAATIEGESLPFVADETRFEDLPLTVVEGERPDGADEIALGIRSASRLGVDIGDRVTVSTVNGDGTAVVSGFVVMPPAGPFISDRAGLGTGLFLPGPFYDELLAVGERSYGLEPGTIVDTGSFVAIDLTAGTDPQEFVDSLGDTVVSWDALGEQPFVYTDSARPAQIADVASMRDTPALLAALVAVAMTVGLALAVGVAVRTRRRELALLRALGATGAQLRATLRWQALTIVGTGLVLGVPLGIALGRVTWRAFADDLGISTSPDIPPLWIGIVAAGGLVVALLVSALPGRVAARVSPAEVLRSE